MQREGVRRGGEYVDSLRRREWGKKSNPARTTPSYATRCIQIICGPFCMTTWSSVLSRSQLWDKRTRCRIRVILCLIVTFAVIGVFVSTVGIVSIFYKDKGSFSKQSRGTCDLPVFDNDSSPYSGYTFVDPSRCVEGDTLSVDHKCYVKCNDGRNYTVRTAFNSVEFGDQIDEWALDGYLEYGRASWSCAQQEPPLSCLASCDFPSVDMIPNSNIDAMRCENKMHGDRCTVSCAVGYSTFDTTSEVR